MLKKIALITLLLATACYGFVYFSFSYGVHDEYPDSKQYHKIVESPLDLSAADSPYIYRQFTPYLTNKLIKITSNNSASSNAETICSHLFTVNLLGVFAAMILLSLFLLNHLKINDIQSLLLAPLLLFLSYKVMHQAIGNLCEGWAYFFIGLIYYLYARKKLGLMVAAIIFSVIVKETIVLFFVLFFIGLLVAKYVKKEPIERPLIIGLSSAFASLLLYVILRKFAFAVAGYENQLNLLDYPTQLLSFLSAMDWVSFAKIILHQNVLLILVALLLYKKGLSALNFSSQLSAWFLSILALVIICMCTGMMYNDISRIISTATPVCIMIFWSEIFTHQQSK